MPRTHFHRAPLLLLAASASLALSACGGSETSGNAVEMRDMEVVDGTVNDSMTDLDAVKADGVGNVNNAGNVSQATEPRAGQDGSNADAETVASE
jgi:hypothetical protein